MSMTGIGNRGKSPKSVKTLFILWVVSWFLLGGLHRFYAGKTLSGLLYLFTAGGFFVGTILDGFKVTKGRFTDKAGLPICE